MIKRKQTDRDGAPFLNTATALVVVLPLMLATPVKAFGYTDPGTGAFVYQAAYAAFLGGSFYLRKFLNHFFNRNKKSISSSLPQSNKP